MYLRSCLIDVSSIVLRKQLHDASVPLKGRQVEGGGVVVGSASVHIDIFILQEKSYHLFLWEYLCSGDFYVTSL